MRDLSKEKTRQVSSSFGAGRSDFDKVVSHKGCNYEVHDPSLPGPGYY